MTRTETNGNRRGAAALAALGATCLLVAVPASAAAWHKYNHFQTNGRGDTAQTPLGHGLLYSGAPHDFSMTCAACHIRAPGRIRANVTFNPPVTGDLFSPNTRYTVTVEMRNEHLGYSGCSGNNPNTNSFLAYFSDGGGRDKAGEIYNHNGARACGSMTGGGAEGLGQSIVRGSCEYAGAQYRGRDPSWRFQWQSPRSGDATLWVGMVDGDCAARGAGKQNYDNDDVAMFELALRNNASAWILRSLAGPYRFTEMRSPILGVLRRRDEVS